MKNNNSNLPPPAGTPENGDGGFVPTGDGTLFSKHSMESIQTMLAELCNEMMHVLHDEKYGSQTLRRQADLLDKMIYKLMSGYTDDCLENENSLSSNLETLNLFLRMQKQCIDTLKAASAVEYMSALATAALPRPTPPPEK